MSGDFSADLEHEHRIIDAGIEAYLASDQREPADRRADLVHAIDVLRRHIYIEEAYLFPPLRALGLAGPVAVMIHEHARMWLTLADLEAHPDDPAETNRARCEELLTLLAAHNGKEEGIVYATARERLPQPDQVELASIVASAQLPADWVCEGLGPITIA